MLHATNPSSEAAAAPLLHADPGHTPGNPSETMSSPVMSLASPAVTQHEAGAPNAAVWRERESKHPAGAQQEAGRETASNSNSPAGPRHAVQVSSPAKGQDTGLISSSSAGVQHEAGVSSAAAGRERSEAARRGTRNKLLLSLHRVAVTELAEYQDLPLAAGQCSLILQNLFKCKHATQGRCVKATTSCLVSETESGLTVMNLL